MKNYLNDTLPNHWIGRGGEIQWPPRSPDLNPMDFFVWPYLKAEVNKIQPNNELQLQAAIRSACEKISPTILSKVRKKFYNRLSCCLINNGGHFEQFL